MMLNMWNRGILIFGYSCSFCVYLFMFFFLFWGYGKYIEEQVQQRLKFNCIVILMGEGTIAPVCG